MELYLHVPFCAQKCQYCDFASYAGRMQERDRYVQAVLTEAQARASSLPATAMETVFIGGGTPSVLSPDQLDTLLCGIHALFPVASGAEYTTEANPGTLTAEWLDVAVSHGVNRLSLGMQAFQPQLLKTLGRIHTFSEVAASVELARNAGLHNISLDLMFGLPGQTRADWLESLHAAISLQPQHLSCYGLIPEEGTPLWRKLESGELSLPDEETERAMYDDALTRLAQHGYIQYEISNFAKEGCACRHNLGYWRQIPYLGLGCSASSMLPDASGQCSYLRETNPASLDDYIAMTAHSAWHNRAVEPIFPADARFETLMLGLRTIEGVSEHAYADMHGEPLRHRYGETLRRLQQNGLLDYVDGCWRLTRRGMDVQNAVLVELMEVDDP